MAGQGVRIYLGYPAGCEASDADSRKAFGNRYSETDIRQLAEIIEEHCRDYMT